MYLLNLIVSIMELVAFRLDAEKYFDGVGGKVLEDYFKTFHFNIIPILAFIWIAKWIT